MADDKTARNRAAGDEHSLYKGQEPEQTLEWKAADALDAAEAEIARLKEALHNLAEHCDQMESQHEDYHLLADGGIPCRSQPLNAASDLLQELRERARAAKPPAVAEDVVDLRGKIGQQFYIALERLGAKADLLACAGSYGDTLSDEEVLDALTDFNESGAVIHPRPRPTIRLIRTDKEPV